MRVALKLHPQTPARTIRGVEVEAHDPNARQMRMRYAVTGDLSRLVLPPPAAPERADELWRTTCFEAFAQRVGAESYDEFNFSPSTQWAVYRFDAYRAGVVTPELAPRIEGGFVGDAYVLHAAFDLPETGPWRVGIAAVIEETDGTKSYWALAHPAAQPDFHHADSFVLELA